MSHPLILQTLGGAETTVREYSTIDNRVKRRDWKLHGYGNNRSWDCKYSNSE